ncbi:MAG: response regulator, partial [Bacteroidota bacterium]
NIHRNAQHLKNLTDELLDLSKIDSGNLVIEKKIVQVPSFLQSIIDNYKSFANFQQIEFYIYWSFEKDLSLAIDVGKVQKILHNLLSNAFKFTPSHGTIKVFGSWEKQRLNLRIADTGKGIAPADQVHIFDRYYQVQDQRETLGLGGAGIGLAICHEYLKLMQGTIEVESQLGKGTTFTVQIPAEKVENDKVELLSSPLEHDIALQNSPIINTNQLMTAPVSKAPQLLIAEDNMELANYLKTVLTPKYNVRLVQNGKEAWQILQTDSFDLLVSDIMMPEMNGMELITKIKQQSNCQRMPILMLTALTNANEKIKALRIGVDDYIHKPFLMEELEIRIENLIRRHKNRKEGLALSDRKGFSADETWLTALEQTAARQISDPDFTVRQLAEALNISERSLFNRVKSLVGTTPGDYLREVRLSQARTLLEQKQYKTVSEVCYAVGFQKPSYFAQLFKKRFGHLPSKYFK